MLEHFGVDGSARVGDRAAEAGRRILAACRTRARRRPRTRPGRVLPRHGCAAGPSSEGVGGWVRNRPDGTVEAVFEGRREAVERLVALLRARARAARTSTRVERFDEEPEGLTRFSVR